MILLPVLLSLTAILLPSYGDAQSVSFESLSTEHEEIQHEIVDKHNALRAQASPPAANMLQMEWSEEAQKSAQSWANKCTLTHSDVASRTIGSICGENLFMSTAPVPWSKAVQAWYDEVEYFVFGKGSTSNQAVGHYTQVMWYSSYKVGCGCAECPNASYKYFFVCHYCPAGNILPRQNSPYEVGTPCAKCPKNCSNNLCTNPCEHTDGYSNCSQLKKQYSCSNQIVKKNCKASCECTNKIY
ncbi:cysteine-rich secretory protein 3-like isoform X2 [Phascolarctos cinereus]|nr:cysteine-rich secretory protein 3-like isoform X2 [Phascolarctos cinereus]XP_020849619.1 cysteine-rich secretory protein 3-like isoform X2 [Phascolarctos cinereus]XP_020849620.1 cysteine-rich secretory protein 3-like isoform X2 [Phascolarctos cinereus]